jgi:anti-anti-sigma factor
MADLEEPPKLPASDFGVEQHSDARGVVLVLSGELDLASAPEVEAALADVGALTGQRVLFDLTELTFMDSTGVSVLVRAKQDADAGGYTVAIRAPNGQVHRLLELVGLLNRLDVED